MYFKVTTTYSCPVETMEIEGDKVDLHKTIKKDFLVNAVSVTDAEAKTIRELPNNYENKCVKGVTLSNIGSIVFKSGDMWFLFGVKYLQSVNEKTGKSKYSHEYILINGDDISDALDNMKEHHADTVSEYKIVTIAESKMTIDNSLLTSDTIVEKEETYSKEEDEENN